MTFTLSRGDLLKQKINFVNLKEKMDSVYKQIKIHEPENLHKYKYLENLSYEVKRLECVLTKGMVSKKMFDELVLKLNILEEEHLKLHSSLIMKANRREGGLSIYHNNYLEFIEKNHEKILRKFKAKSCEWCRSVILDEIGICPDEDCVSNDYSSTDEEYLSE